MYKVSSYITGKHCSVLGCISNLYTAKLKKTPCFEQVETEMLIKHKELSVRDLNFLSDADFYCLITCNQHLQHAFTGWNDPCLFSLFQCNLSYSAQNHNSSRLRAFYMVR